jgi:hypothetical protein
MPFPAGLFGQKLHLPKTLLKSGVVRQSRRDQRNPLALSLLPLSQPDAWAATVLVDELYPDISSAVPTPGSSWAATTSP